ncbi:hypothetical protein ES332_A06G005200v1 [Gossypium tomentosum]|uniref:Phosphotransferase n=1 Tax=Gossypium tomentosum TaxID=34277 RepID=A0A5D2PXT5_GOSTO|nr:hypothetical protein ES332_A06G005200v1 [Gossypium tomentosum]
MSVTAIATATSSAIGSFRTRRSTNGVSRFKMSIRSSFVSMAAAPMLTKLQQDCATPLPVLRNVASSMSDDIRAGLAVDGGSDLKMILSYVDSLPTGDEKGLFYALDLGGTNFRVLRVELGGKDKRVIAIESDQVSIPQELMSATSEELFDFIASALANFANKGGTFLEKKAGKDVVACLNEAMDRKGIDMRVSALVNDTVATLAGARYWDDDVMVAVILGTGTNACYVERMDCIPKLQGEFSPSGRTIVNLEWGAFSKGLPLTVFDRDMDAASINPGEQIFEKTISGMYLGEIARRALLHMAEEGSLFGKSVPEKLSMPFVLGTPDLSTMQQDGTEDLHTVGSVLYNVAGVESDLSSRKIVLEVCDTIVKRAARLAGAGIVILQKIEEDTEDAIFGKRTVVAMDGGLYERYPQYRRYLKKAVAELLGPETSQNIVIEHSKDGSGIGAALLAATNSKYGRNL